MPEFSAFVCTVHADFTQCKAGMQAIFTTSTPFPSLISVAQLWQEPEANQLPHQYVCTVTSTVHHYSSVEKISKNTGTKLAAGNNYKCFPQVQLSFCHGTIKH